MTQLTAMRARTPAITPHLPVDLLTISTPLVLSRWCELLQHHPDTAFSSFILEGIKDGFRIGFKYNGHSLKPRSRNLLSAVEHQSVVDSYIEKELLLERMVYITDPSTLPWVYTSPFGVIPKKHRPGKWRLIVDLSAPDGHSVNDFIEKDLSTLSYISIDNIAQVVLQLGRGTLLGKLDVKEAFRLVPVHPSDRLLLGMVWKGNLYIDKVLPFGLRTAPLLFTALADALEWVIRNRGVSQVFHYVDDFIFAGSPSSSQCSVAMATAIQVCTELGIPIDSEKNEGPATTLSVLGIEFDTEAMILRLPNTKLTLLRQQVQTWRGRKCCSKRELLSLIGSLQHAASVVKPGRAFVRRMIDLSTTRKHPEAKIRLSWEFRSDLEWWHHMAASWNGTSMLAPIKKDHPDITVTSDASGGWGCGAFWESKWFQLQWSGAASSAHITIQELIPIVLAAALWGHFWAGKTVRALSDNMAVVHIINCKQSRNTDAMHLIRCLTLIECAYDFVVVSKHLPGKHNSIADALSRNQQSGFLSLYPQASPLPTPVPSSLLQVVVCQKPDWTCVNWATLFANIFNKA